jgi:hypothetical protein
VVIWIEQMLREVADYVMVLFFPSFLPVWCGARPGRGHVASPSSLGALIFAKLVIVAVPSWPPLDWASADDPDGGFVSVVARPALATIASGVVLPGCPFGTPHS